MEIVQLLCPSNKYSIKCPYGMKPEGITIHNTANDASAKNEVSYMNTNNNQVSYHYAVDDVRAVQGLPLDRNGWHAGDGGSGYGNRKTIGIEICYSKSGGDRFHSAEKNTAELIARLMLQYGWTPNQIGTKIINTHQSRSGKYCPHRTLDEGINRLYDMIKSKYAELKGEPTPTPAPSSSGNSYTVKITASVLNVRSGPGTNYKINTTIKKNEVYTIVEENNGWGKLKSGAGWISLAYTTKNTSSSNNSSSNSNNTGGSGYMLGLYVVNTASGLNVRSGAGTNYSIKRTYPNGTRFDTYEIKGEWARTPSGWVCLKYCKLVRKY